MIKLFFYSIFLVLVYGLPTYGQTIDPRQKIIAQYDSIQSVVPREKIYAHLDRNTYLPADTIWFKAYLVGASGLTTSNISGLIYTEIINENGETIESLALPTAFGLTWGSFVIKTEKYLPGKYTFRAYTNWMQNFGEGQFFKKEITILPLTTTPLVAKKAATLKPRDIDVQFLPEGGSWLANQPQKMAFKALNANGIGIKVSGQILDSKQQKVADFATNDKGMGQVNLIPAWDEIYTAQINYNGLIRSIQLQKAKNEGIALKVTNLYQNDSLSVIAYGENLNQEYTIVGQSRGTICFVASLKFANSSYKKFKIAKSTFPTGICQIILLDDKNKVVNERNFFINHNDELNLSMNTQNSPYGLRDSIPIQLKVEDAFGKPSIASFSVVVTDDAQVAKDSLNDENILTYFLMNSDLKGNIEKPGYYFKNPTAQKHNDLDALMLTQGWVSYDWDLSKKPQFKAEKEYAFGGRVSNLFDKSIPKAKIVLLGNNKGFLMMDTLTNEKGEFIFKNFPIMDSASFVIQALNANGKRGTLGLVMNEFNPPIALKSTKQLFEVEIIDSISNNLIATKAQEYKLTHKEAFILAEVNIVGKKMVKNSKNLNGPGESDYTITEQDLARVAKKTLYDVLFEKVQGFREGFTFDKANGTAPKSSSTKFFIKTNVLKFVIDGIELDFFYTPDTMPDSYYRFIKTYLDYYSAEDIKAIEVMEHMRYTANYKIKFIENVQDDTVYSFLEITTHTGNGPFLKKAANMYLYRPMNYGNSRTFYNPKYNATNKAANKPDFRATIYLQPNLITNAKGEANFSFYSADKPGTYTIWVEGTDMLGNFGFQTKKIVIK